MENLSTKFINRNHSLISRSASSFMCARNINTLFLVALAGSFSAFFYINRGCFLEHYGQDIVEQYYKEIPAQGLFLYGLSFFPSFPLFLLGLGRGVRPLYIAGLFATILIAFFPASFHSSAGAMLFRAFSFFIFSVLGPFVLVNLALCQYTNASGKVEWYPTTSLSRVLGLLAFGVYGMQLCLYILDDPNLNWPVFFNVISIKVWVIQIFICGIFAQWILVRLKCNLRPSIASDKMVWVEPNESQKKFFDFIKSKSTKSMEFSSLNTLYYMNFYNKYKLNRSTYKMIAFNLPAFLFSNYWFFYRKMYLYGILLTTFYVLLGFLVYFVPFSNIMFIYLVSSISIGFISTPLYIKFSERKLKKGIKESGVSPLSVFVVFIILTFIGSSMGRASFSSLSLFPDFEYWEYFLDVEYNKKYK